ncbi:hypothetical protein [Xanthobacter versatilis]|uniref:hypothetical protein n=1 Tax=Xanthobacter autotrophicus (strain ATCC BAA-1158 / Py2) TaxID=78245 RepID=UPI00372C3C13
MDFEIQFKFAGRLLPGERILWTGQPGQGVIFTARDIPLTLFFLVWTGFPTFGVVSQGLKGNWAFPIFALPFLVVGTYMLVFRYFFDVWIRARTFYAITDRRVLIWRDAPGPWRSFMALDRSRIDVTEWAGSPERGTVYLADSAALRAGSFRTSGFQLQNTRPQFYAIAEPERVFNLLQQPVQGNLRPPAPATSGAGADLANPW